MDAIQRIRKQIQRTAAKPLGIDASVDRVWGPEVSFMGQEAELLRLPENVLGGAPIQNTSGVDYFMNDFHPVDGTDSVVQ